MQSAQTLLLILYYYLIQFNNIILAKFLALLLKSMQVSLSRIGEKEPSTVLRPGVLCLNVT